MITLNFKTSKLWEGELFLKERVGMESVVGANDIKMIILNIFEFFLILFDLKG